MTVHDFVHTLRGALKGGAWRFDGLLELLPTEDPEHGNELCWTRKELRPQDLAALRKEKRDLDVFRTASGQPEIPWYLCEVLLVEIHDTGSHDDAVLIWINTYWLKAPNTEAAYKKALTLGRECAGDLSHRCNGDLAHWEFGGVIELRQSIDPPGDGALLWCEDFLASPESLAALVPAKADLGVFEWEGRESQ